MKQCPKCGHYYTEKDINFCLNDGELLFQSSLDPSGSASQISPQGKTDDPPPTVVMDRSRITNPVGWHPTASPPAAWQPHQPQSQALFSQYSAAPAPSQTLAIVALVMGIASITVGWCCYSGILLAPAAIIIGIVAMVQNKNDPNTYGGRGLAIGGIATGIGYFVLLTIFLVIYGLALIGGSIS